MKQKRYWFRGGIVGVMLAIIISIYFATQNGCIGSYVNLDGAMGTICPKVNVIANLTWSIIPELGTIIILFLIGAFVGWIYGKIRKSCLV